MQWRQPGSRKSKTCLSDCEAFRLDLWVSTPLIHGLVHAMGK